MMTKLALKVTRTNPGCDKAVTGAVAGPPGRVYLHMHVMLCFTVLGLVPVSDNGSPPGAYIPVIILPHHLTVSREMSLRDGETFIMAAAN